MKNSPNLPVSVIDKVNKATGCLSPEEMQAGEVYTVMYRCSQSVNLIARFAGMKNGHAVFIDQEGAEVSLLRSVLREIYDIAIAKEEARSAFENFQVGDLKFFKLLQNRRLLKQE